SSCEPIWPLAIAPPSAATAIVIRTTGPGTLANGGRLVVVEVAGGLRTVVEGRGLRRRGGADRRDRRSGRRDDPRLRRGHGDGRRDRGRRDRRGRAEDARRNAAGAVLALRR